MKKEIQSSVIMADHVFLHKRNRSKEWDRPPLCSCGGRIDLTISDVQCVDCLHRFSSMEKK